MSIRTKLPRPAVDGRAVPPRRCVVTRYSKWQVDAEQFQPASPSHSSVPSTIIWSPPGVPETCRVTPDQVPPGRLSGGLVVFPAVSLTVAGIETGRVAAVALAEDLRQVPPSIGLEQLDGETLLVVDIVDRLVDDVDRDALIGQERILGAPTPVIDHQVLGLRHPRIVADEQHVAVLGLGPHRDLRRRLGDLLRRDPAVEHPQHPVGEDRSEPTVSPGARHPKAVVAEAVGLRGFEPARVVVVGPPRGEMAPLVAR